MHFVYILRSLKNNKRYVGMTSKDVSERLKEHNRHSNKWTRENGPFILLYKEKYEDKGLARKRERFLKSGQGRKWLDEHLPI